MTTERPRINNLGGDLRSFETGLFSCKITVPNTPVCETVSCAGIK